MRHGAALQILSLLCVVLASANARALSEFGIEGMGVVSTPADEQRASISPDGERIVWGSTGRAGGAGGADLWQATLRDGRWQDPRPLPMNSAGDDIDPMFSADGGWLYFASDRAGGHGGDDLYRATVLADGGFGPAENLGAAVNGRGNERAPTPSRDGRHLLFASDGPGGAGGLDLFVARRDGEAFATPVPAPGINSAADEAAAAWLGDGAAIVFARSDDIADKPVILLVAQCDGEGYVAAAPLALSFNRADARTLGPVLDWNNPGELLISGSAKAPRAGRLDIYRMRVPAITGSPGCV